MTKPEAVSWIINLMADIGKTKHYELWHYEQTLTEIKEMLESEMQVNPCTLCQEFDCIGCKFRRTDNGDYS